MVMNMLLSYIILFYCIVSNINCTRRNQKVAAVKPKGPRPHGYANYIARPRYGNRLGDTEQNEDEANFDSNMFSKDSTGAFFDNNEAGNRLERRVLNDQRPRGTIPYRMRHRYFGGKKRGEESNNAVKRVVLTLRTKSKMNDKRFADAKSNENSNIRNIHDSSARKSALLKDQYDDLKFITPNDLAIELNDDDINDDVDGDAQFMQEDFSKMSNAELDAVIANRMNSYMMQKDLDNADYAEKKKNEEKKILNKRSYKEDSGLKQKKSTSVYRNRDEINYSVDTDEFLDLDNAVRNNLVKDGRRNSVRRLSADDDTDFDQFNDNTSDDDLRTLLRSH